MRTKKMKTQFNTRQYMIADNFEVYYYSDVNFSNVQSHSHDYYEFYLFVEGDVTIHAGNQDFHPVEGSVLVIPPHVKHYLLMNNPSVPYRRYVFWISEEYAERLVKRYIDHAWLMQKAVIDKVFSGYLNFDEMNDVHHILLSLLEETHSERYGKEAVMDTLVSQLILKLNRLFYEQEHPQSETEDEADLLESLITYIQNHLNEQLDLDTLSERFFVSKFYISHLFTDTFGISLHQYIQKRRLSSAREALLRGEKAAAIYSDCGFNDYSAFFRAFKKEYGLSPKEYQAVYLNDPEKVK